jgi:hypothetical protein
LNQNLAEMARFLEPSSCIFAALRGATTQSFAISWRPDRGWTHAAAQSSTVDLVLYFGRRAALADLARFEELKALFPGAVLLGCSTGGQIIGDDIAL